MPSHLRSRVPGGFYDQDQSPSVVRGVTRCARHGLSSRRRRSGGVVTVGYTSPGTTITNSAGFVTWASGPGAKETITGAVVTNTGGAGDITIIGNNSASFFVSASALGGATATANAFGALYNANTNGGGGTAIGIINNNSSISGRSIAWERHADCERIRRRHCPERFRI